MASEQFHFVPAKEQYPNRTTREVELIQANTRSHVSRVSYIASQTKQVHKPRIPSHKAAVFRWRLKPPSKQHRPATPGPGTSHQVSQFNIPPMIGDSYGPDPFVPFPDSTSVLDQKLFQFLMMHASQRLFGAQQQAGFDYIRDVTMPKVFLGREFLSWSAYSAAKLRNTLSPQFSENWLLERRVQNYQLLRRMIDRQQSIPWDYVVTCLVSAGYMEYSYGQVAEGLMHLKAALILIKQQHQGLRCLQTMRTVYANTILTTTSITGIPMIFHTITPFPDALTAAMHSLSSLQTWNKVLRYGNYTGNNTRHRDSGTGDQTEDILASSQLHHYWQARHQSLEVQPLHSYLQTSDLPEGQAYEWRSRLIALYLLNSILSNLGRDAALAKHFLFELGAMITSSMHPSTPRAFHPFIPMIAVCAQRLGIWYYRGPESPLPAIRTWEAILFAEVMMVASHAVRQRVMEAMVHWLYDGPEELHDSAVLDEDELLMLEVNIREHEAATKLAWVGRS